jgi:hypothetical protein
VTCAVGLACGKQDICATVVDVSKSCDVGVTTSCVAGATCVVSDGGTTGTCMASGVKAGTACNPDGIGAPGCWDTAGFFCASTNLCEPITYGAAASSCAPVDGGITKAGCTDGVCYGGSCLAHVTSGQTCAVGSGACVSATVCIDADGGAGGTCTPLKTNCHGDAGTPPFSFSPSNVGLGTIYTMASQALAENVSQPCGVNTESTGSPTDATCLNSPITIVTQEDGSTVNLVVVQSLTLQSNGAITVTGGVPLVIVSLSDVTFLGSSFIQANSTSNLGQTGPGGAPESDGDTMGGGTGGGAPASGTALIGGGGAGYCGLGGLGGGSTAAAGKRYGNQVIRPLIGGSAGGGGVVGGGGGGGAIEIVAAGSFTMSSGSYINAGGQGGVGEGGGGDQNGGGAGSGGSILIEAPVVTIAGTLAANGGGGGGGVLNAPDGSPNATFAAGGAAGTGGVAGGNGGAAAILNGSPGATATGNNSSGGGGGVGRIRIASSAANATLTGSVISPSPTTVCATQGDLRDITAGP